MGYVIYVSLYHRLYTVSMIVPFLLHYYCIFIFFAMTNTEYRRVKLFSAYAYIFQKKTFVKIILSIRRICQDNIYALLNA